MNRKDISRRMIKLSSNWGVSLLEMLGSIAIGSVVLVGVAQQTNTYIDNTKDAYTAEHARLYAAAARAYVKENASTISATPSLVDQSKIEKYLPVGFGAGGKNSYGQTPQILLRKKIGGEVEGYLVYDGGTPISSARSKFVAVMAGVGGGFVDTSGTPQGAGWKDTSYTEFYASKLSATVGRPVVSLSLLSPVDPQDCRYLSIFQGTTGCGETLQRDLDMGVYGINVTSITNVKNITGGAGSTINIIGATSFSNTVNVTSSVIIGGALSATGIISGNAFSPALKVGLGSSCADYSLGTIAQLSASIASDKGSLLSCQQETSSDGLSTIKSWRPFFSASEEKLAIIGCWKGNDYCKEAPEVTCFERDKKQADGVTKCDFKHADTTNGSDQVDGRGLPQYWWETKIGERTFCAVGFHAQTQSTLAAKEDGTTVTGAPNHTFCRVYPKKENGVDIWYVKVGSAYQTPVSCHAVCLKGL